MVNEVDLNELLRTAVSVLALLLSSMALVLSVVLWRRTNRPIVAAYVRTNANAPLLRTYDLAVVNSGSRPAVNVRLHVHAGDLMAALAPGVATAPRHAVLLADVRRCFSSDGEIGLLLNGETKTNSFGYTGPAGGEGPFWQHAARFNVRITYADLDQRTYSTSLQLHIKDSEAFGGGAWR